MLNIIVPYSSQALLIEIWSDWTQTHSRKDRHMKQSQGGDKQKGDLVCFFFYNILNVHLVN